MLPDWYWRLAEADRLLAGIALAAAALLVLSLLFALGTIGLRLRSMRRRRVRGTLERAWEPLVLAALSGDVRADELHRAVPSGHALFFVAYLLRFVHRFTGDERRVLRELARPYLPGVAAQLGERQAEVRARAVQTLVLLGLEEYDRVVVSALDDESLTVAMVAARALASREHTRFTAGILERLHRFRHWNPIYLASLFSGMGSYVVPALREILADEHAVPFVRRVAADALHDLDDIASADTAARITRNSTDVELVAACIRLLARVGGPAHADVARGAIGQPNALLRLRAVEALGELGGPQDLLRLRAAVDDASPWVSLAAARALARSGGRDLLASLESEPGPRGELAREVLAEGGRRA